MSIEIKPLYNDEQLNKVEQNYENGKEKDKISLAMRLFDKGHVSLDEAAHLADEHPAHLEHIFSQRGLLPKHRMLVCGGAGFMGSYFIKYMLQKHPHMYIVNYDKLTYSGNLKNLHDVSFHPRYTFVRGDIANEEHLEKVIKDHKINTIVNYAAETHVDRSIMNADPFLETNVKGTHSLLKLATKHDIKLIQISTDEVFGSIDSGAFTEEHPFRPNSPYSATKASGDLLARSYNKTYGTKVIVTHSCNVMGPFQYPEKLIPLFVTNVIESKKLPVYGDGQNRREWIFVEDHARAIDFLLEKGKVGEVYNIGSEEEKTNMDITEMILAKMNKSRAFIEYVDDRRGHDKRYAIDSTKLRSLGWEPRYKFSDAMDLTIKWYTANKDWWEPIKSGDFKKYYNKQYRA
ncbi:MAG: dTDP-glucose 4,6-dehydratase [Candidatus Spechtbacterales bacterium]|nr:dTDP-glucose 4,6-dehydratase [Candidatus Spechtbacterales bacterium]